MSPDRSSDPERELKEKLRSGDVEGYLADGGSLLAAVRWVAPTKDADRLRRICKDADLRGIDTEKTLEIAGILRSAEVYDIAGRFYLRVYEDGCIPEESIAGFADCAKKDRSLLETALEAERLGGALHASMLSLLMDRRVPAAADLAASAGPDAFRDEYGRYDLYGLVAMSRSMTRLRRYADAADMGRTAVELNLLDKGPEISSLAAELVKDMGRTEAFEELDPPHSAWVEDLRRHYPDAYWFWERYDRMMSRGRRGGRG